MNYLLDTHALLWWLMADPRLSRTAKDVIDNAAFSRHVSAVSGFEIANKVHIGKLEQARPAVETFDVILVDAQLTKLNVTHAHALLAGTLESPHRDPFDRLLAAQAMLEGLTLVTADRAFTSFDVPTLW
ncbi:type II toxin-antitoxin system VapC family toxin [Affinirhizobium pseudoryzae]|jgi:PIN domain nuclease of toxin-antitoxin system|uniref:type II toxin-antitoxin system VapC family toxin n=1 Tax=Allorhizobium pseudoryzae TaxID=379684 RepID=UPI0013EBCF2E|nr:type II toxin-antitoxin system VapC family toxin [Allorhizobium pseudoryzae]